MKFALATAALAATAYAAPSPSVANLLKVRQANPGITDATILNYALTLEYLEDTFYQQAIAKYSQADFAAAGFDSTFYNNLKTISADEQTHVAFINATLYSVGSPAVSRATYDFKYMAASNDTTTQIKGFVATASILEGVGVSAYLGAAAEIMSAAYLTAAGSILTTESRHSSYIRASLKQSPFPSPFDVPLTFNEVFTLAAPFITKFDPKDGPLPFKAFPSLNVTSSKPMPKVGDAVNILFTKGETLVAADGKSPIYAAFITVTGPVFTLATPITMDGQTGFSAVIPKADAGKAPVAGQSYVILTGCNTTVTDDTTKAGPGVVEVYPS